MALPVFAFTSAGVTITANPSMLTNTITVGVITGLVVGKLVGITGGAWLATRLDPSLRWIDIIGMSQLAGIGFTISLLFSELSYPIPHSSTTPKPASCSAHYSPAPSAPSCSVSNAA